MIEDPPPVRRGPSALFAFFGFRLLLLAVRARKGRMALRAVGYRRRLCASSAVGPAAAGGRLEGWP